MSASRSSVCLFASLVALTAWASTTRAQDAAILTYKGPDRAQRLIDGAAKEGAVVLYSAMIVNQALRPVTAAFQKRHPAIKMTYWRGDSEEIAVKIGVEQRAGRLVADIVEGTGIGEIAVQAGFAQPAWSPELAAIPEQRRDPRGLWVPTRMSYFGLAYNTRMVPEAEAPRSYEDLLDAKWKGRMAWPLTSASAAPLFVTNLRVAWGEEKAEAYLRRLAAQGVVNFGAGNARTLVDRVIAGEHALALQIFAHHPLISAGKGAPVATRLLPPVASAAGTMAIPRGARHPHAALLLMDFILSAEGQRILAGAEYLPVREDVEPLPQIAPIVPQKAGVPENFVPPEKLNAYTERSAKLIEQLFR